MSKVEISKVYNIYNIPLKERERERVKLQLIARASI